MPLDEMLPQVGLIADDSVADVANDFEIVRSNVFERNRRQVVRNRNVLIGRKRKGVISSDTRSRLLIAVESKTRRQEENAMSDWRNKHCRCRSQNATESPRTGMC